MVGLENIFPNKDSQKAGKTLFPDLILQMQYFIREPYC